MQRISYANIENILIETSFQEYMPFRFDKENIHLTKPGWNIASSKGYTCTHVYVKYVAYILHMYLWLLDATDYTCLAWNINVLMMANRY